MARRFGLSVALTTPVDGAGALVLPAAVAHGKRCLANGCDSVTLFGTTGEGSSVGMFEREAAVNAFLAAGVTGDQLVMGVLVDAVEDAVHQARFALEKGARNILLAPPSYFKNVGDEGLFGWFSAVIEGLGSLARGILLYNIPSVTTVQLSHALIGRLRAAYPQAVAGVKDSGGDWSYTEALLKAHGDLIILIGDERHLAQGTRLGGQGAISGMANFATRAIEAMAVRGETDTRVEAMVLELLKYPVTPAVKVLVAHVTGEAIWTAVRPPLVPIDAAGRTHLVSAFESLFKAKAA